VDRRGLKDKTEERSIKDLFNFLPLPSLRNRGGFVRLRSYCSRGVCRQCPRGVGKPNERLSKHRVQEGEIIFCHHQPPLISLMSQSKFYLFDSSRWAVCILQREKVVPEQKPRQVAGKKAPRCILEVASSISSAKKKKLITCTLERANSL
jgi:hypothetical protein